MTESTIDLIYNTSGIIGVAMIIITYFLLQDGKMSSGDLAFPVYNLVGAILILISLYRFYNFASVVIEIFWIAISLYGIWKIKNKTKYKD